MQCPKCHSKFEHINTSLGDIERCTACKGLWLDAYEIEKMKPLADAVDIGDAGEFKDLAKIDLSDFFKRFLVEERL